MAKEINFKYKRRQYRLYLILGFIMLVVSIGARLFDDTYEFSASFIGIGVFYLLSGLYYWRVPYLKINGDIIIKNDFLINKRDLNAVTSISKFADEYTFKTEDQELLVNYNLMEKADQEKFFEFVEEMQGRIAERQN